MKRLATIFISIHLLDRLTRRHNKNAFGPCCEQGTIYSNELVKA